jgi:hypothetical protein
MATAAIGHNQPEPFELVSESINDLLLEAENFLDGSPIENEEQENAVASILTRLRREAKGADEMRAAERKPHDDAAKQVQAKWKPLLTKAELAINCAKNALGAYLQRKEAEQRAIAAAAAEEARQQAERAREAAAQANPDDFAGAAAVRILQENAADAAKKADRLDKVRAQATGGERAVGLRSTYRAEITDALAFGKWAWTHRQSEYLQFLGEIAARESRHGPKGIPGLTVHEDRKAV